MDHNQAVEEMSAELYLLDELSPEARDEFEAHMFECAACALDVRAGAAFIDQAKSQFRTEAQTPAPATARNAAERRSRDWHAWLRPAFAVPAFAVLVMCVAYQNLVTIPGLRTAATQPRLLSVAPLHGATRGAAQTLTTDRAHGLVLPVELPSEPAMLAYTSYAIDLYRPDGKLVWTGGLPAPHDGAEPPSLSLVLPGAMLQSGTYSLSIAGIGDHGDRTDLERISFQVSVTH